MKEKPILFSGPMVRAILEGRKTQTRRMVKPQPRHRPIIAMDGQWYDADCINPGVLMKCPYGAPGTRLWLRETWAEHPEVPGTAIYRADRGGDYQGAAQGHFKWRPSIFMPRWASRITLEITNVRMERLHDISEGDAIAEGVEVLNIRFFRSYDRKEAFCTTARRSYETLWASINGPGSWEKNPWVWVVSFKRITP